MDAFRKTFGRLKGAVIGMIHLRALPGTPKSTLKLDEIIRIACTEAEMYQKEKVDAIIVENMHDRPWQRADQLGPETVANMAVVARTLRQHCPALPIGVQVLSAGNRQALAVAAAAGCQFIRTEGFVFSHIGDEGTVESCAADLLRYRRSLGAEHIHIFTDIKKKHSSHAVTSDVSLAETAQAAELFLTDGVIVTGNATGQAASTQHVRDVLSAVSVPVLVGSGVTTDNVAHFMGAAGVIVGSHLKTHGHWYEQLDPIRLNHFMKKVNRVRQQDQDELDNVKADQLDLEDDQDLDEEERLKARILKQGE